MNKLQDHASQKRAGDEAAQKGFVGSMLLRLLLLLLVLGQVVFLLGRYRARLDLTTDRIFTLTASTGKVLDKMEDRLFIEAYFSRDDRMPAHDRPRRRALKDLLDEYAALSKGKIVIKYYDPQSDPALRERALRLGMEPQRVADVASDASADTSITNLEVWQGLRLRYSDKKQEVIPYLSLLDFPFQYERILTPRIKILSASRKTRIGVIMSEQNPDKGVVVQGERLPRFSYTNLMRAFAPLYEFVPIRLWEGQGVPDDIDKLIVFRPKEWLDRMKYGLDQFLMRGGKVVMFMDTHEFCIQSHKGIHYHGKPHRTGVGVSYDSEKSKVELLDMLRHYGVDVDGNIARDRVAGTWSLFAFVQATRTGQGQVSPLFYPWCFRVLDKDWKQMAEQFATKQIDGKNVVDEDLKAANEKTFLPGLDKEHDLIKTTARSLARFGGMPCFFWPTKVSLTEKLPEGVTGKVLLRSSPGGGIDKVGAYIEPFRRYRDPEGRLRMHQDFANEWARKIGSEPPMQIPLMVELKGKFSSYFADKPIPKRPQTEAPKKKDEDEAKEEEEAADPLAEKKDDKPGKKDVEPAKKEPQGPQPQGPQPAEKIGDKEPPVIKKAKSDGLLLVIGDADFVRDDYTNYRWAMPKQGDRLPIVGPTDVDAGPMLQRGMPGRSSLVFFSNLLDWLAEDKDLLDLQHRTGVDRSMEFVRPQGPSESQKSFVGRLLFANSMVLWANVLGPSLILLLAGLFLAVRRGAEKRTFLRNAGL